LHAAYDRLDNGERKRIDKLTAQAFAQLTDERIKATIEEYRKKDPSIVPNELHSILATEVRSLPYELESYYKRYFADRQAIVNFSNSYESEFTSRQTQALQYAKELEILKRQIESRNAQLKATAGELNGRYAALARQRNGAEPESYNRRVDQYNADVNNYNSQVRSVSLLIDEYNDILKKYNALALEQRELLKAIDTRPSTISTN
jgi:hypothetical protein